MLRNIVEIAIRLGRFPHEVAALTEEEYALLLVAFQMKDEANRA